jgi:hypothetical protein
MSMPLILVCRCGAEHDASDGPLCRPCQADDACADDRVELGRLWRKREGYRRRGVPHARVDEQAMRLRQRMERRCLAIDPDPTRAHALSTRQAELAGQAVHGRILVPQ